MSNKHKLIPKRRFKEFANADAWEQRKFSEIALRESTVQESSRDFPSVEYEDVIVEAGRLNKDVNQKEVVKKGIVFDGSQVLYGKLRPYLHNWLNPDFSGVAVGDWWVLKPIKVDKSFLYRLIQTQQFDDIANQSAGSKMPRADWNLVSNLEFAVPVAGDEQSKIGGYFSSLVTLITLHQRKLYKLKIPKSAYLSEIIPVEGELNPKRRFPGFAEDWEKKKVSDMFKVTRGQVLSMSLTSRIQDKTNKYPVYSSQTKDDGLMGYYSEYLFDTAITWTTDGANAGTVNYRKGKFFSTNVNGVLLSNDGYCNKAVSEILNLVAYKYVSKVGNPKLMNNVMEEIIISVPRDKNEMNIISDFLIAFDEKISFLQKKINKLEDLKKSYLNEMFV